MGGAASSTVGIVGANGRATERPLPAAQERLPRRNSDDSWRKHSSAEHRYRAADQPEKKKKTN